MESHKQLSSNETILLIFVVKSSMSTVEGESFTFKKVYGFCINVKAGLFVRNTKKILQLSKRVFGIE